MSFKAAQQGFADDLKDIEAQGLYKTERIIASDQKNRITLADGREVINMCANNYLGLANQPELIQAAKDGLDQWGFGLASVRFICGTQSIHKQLEQAMSDFLGMEDTIFNVIVPKEKKIKIKNGKRKTVEEKIYPGYVLVQMVVTDESWYVVRNTPRVTGFLGCLLYTSDAADE